MVAGQITPGRRLETAPDTFGESGDYWLDPATGRWLARVPTSDRGVLADLSGHTVTEHGDGTITVTPSILNSNGQGWSWHGYLEHGAWREV